MLKLRNGADEYKVEGYIVFEEEGELHTSYTIVRDGVTETVSSTANEWEVFIAPDPVVETGTIVEPEPMPVPQPTEEELAAIAEQQAFQTAKAEWLQKKNALATMIDDMERGSKLGITPDAKQVEIMTELATWVNTNMDRRYYF